MERLGDFGLLVNKVGQDNVYQNLLASIDRENLSGSSITVAVVHALSKKVFFAKNARKSTRRCARFTCIDCIQCIDCIDCGDCIDCIDCRDCRDQQLKISHKTFL